MGEAVTGPNPRKSATTGGLRFNLFNLVTAGMYTCVVNTSAGVSMDSFTVRIRGEDTRMRAHTHAHTRTARARTHTRAHTHVHAHTRLATVVMLSSLIQHLLN